LIIFAFPVVIGIRVTCQSYLFRNEFVHIWVTRPGSNLIGSD